MANTIDLKGLPIRKEGTSAAILRPGHFVISRPRTATLPGTLAFPVLGGVAQGVVYENELEGKGITVAYAAGDNVLYGVWPKGGEVLGRVAAANTAIAAGAPLAVTATGTLTTATVGTHHVVAVAMEAVDNSGGASEVFIQVEIV